MASNWMRTLAVSAAGVAGLAVAGLALAAPWNLQAPATKIAADIHSLHEYVMILVTLIFAGVFGAMFYSVYAHRKDKGYKAAQFHESTTVEIIWTIVPFLILIGMALMGEGLGLHIPKGYIYFAMAFSLMVEMLNLRLRARRGTAVKPVELRKPIVENKTNE